MKMWKKMAASGLALAFASQAQATSVFSENFLGATPGANSGLAGTSFSVIGGAVDVVGEVNGNFFSCVGNAGGNCVDMAGSPGLGDIQTTNVISLLAGATYTISFTEILQGYASNDPAISLLNVSLGGFSQQITSLPTISNRVLSFVAGSNDPLAKLRFTSLFQPDGVHGAVISNINIDQLFAPGGVPEPASWALMIAGFGAVGAAARRRAKVSVTYA